MLTKEKSVKGAVYYGETGEITVDFENAKAYATDKATYIREYKGSLFFKGTTILRSESSRYIWRKVGPTCFMNYVKYLKTNQEYNYNLANRNRVE